MTGQGNMQQSQTKKNTLVSNFAVCMKLVTLHTQLCMNRVTLHT